MTKKKLIVSGCSFTNKDFWSQSHPDYDCSFPKWPEILGEKLNLDVVNLGACGSGNNYIYSSLLEEIIRTPKEQIGLVIAAWSQVQRVDWEEVGKFVPKSYTWRDRYNSHMIWRNKRMGKDGNVFYWMIDHLRRFINFDSLCKSHNIPYKQFQMLNPFDSWINGLMKTDFECAENANNPDFVDRYEYEPTLDNMKEDKKYLLKLIVDYEKYIDTNNFIGWPMHLHLDGYTIEQKALTGDIYNGPPLEELIIGGYDAHPNGAGHEKIAEYIHGQLA